MYQCVNSQADMWAERINSHVAVKIYACIAKWWHLALLIDNYYQAFLINAKTNKLTNKIWLLYCDKKNVIWGWPHFCNISFNTAAVYLIIISGNRYPVFSSSSDDDKTSVKMRLDMEWKEDYTDPNSRPYKQLAGTIRSRVRSS